MLALLNAALTTPTTRAPVYKKSAPVEHRPRCNDAEHMDIADFDRLLREEGFVDVYHDRSSSTLPIRKSSRCCIRNNETHSIVPPFESESTQIRTEGAQGVLDYIAWTDEVARLAWRRD